MRKYLMSSLIVLVAMAALLIVSSAAMAAISTSKHDFTSGTGPSTTFRDAGSNATLCNTCHVAHNTAGQGRPLWNHSATSVVSYSWTEVTTLAGTTLPTTMGSQVTKACLSCHDGSVAVGSVLQGTSWGTNKITGINKTTGAASGDMTGNHPVAIPYPDAGGAIYNGITTKANTAQYVAAPTTVRLYGAAVGTHGIECGSCHDPHDTTNTPMLRATQNTLCPACHIR